MIDSGVPIKKASEAHGVRRKTGYRWRDERAGIDREKVRVSFGPALRLEDRVEIEIGVRNKLSLRQIGRDIGRNHTVISYEIKHHSNVDGSYRAVSAQRRADDAVRRPKESKLVVNQELRGEVIAGLQKKWSPQQISETLKQKYPDRPEMQVSHETIYKAIYVLPRGGLKKEVDKALRTGRTFRKPHGRVAKSKNARHIPDKVGIADRPDEVESRKIPGHWEGDLIMGKNNKSAIGTLVERSTRTTLLLHLPDGHGAVQVRDAMIEAMNTLPELLKQSVTWDQGFEMRSHAEITAATGVAIYFADPHSPWQRGTNENTNGLLRQYFPKGTDLSVHSPEELRRVTLELNERPRATLGYRPPLEKFAELIGAATA
ncbi:IS30 family transposase [Rhodococcus sp. Eu-32]|uniref:IS30 family transposase n=1 Tax=Rhodococcus sp. Eu-32 TaxID=1017319 RepID=UPI000DF1344D|nr:IS30 family transposase [Rhodococcus sp. Eu-32]RRQ24902.1 IS30 family transposase [Rhodococcus sp. Eu-32]